MMPYEFSSVAAGLLEWRLACLIRIDLAVIPIRRETNVERLG
jgi:hypothetical protein